jgi:hypothetical protein
LNSPQWVVNLFPVCNHSLKPCMLKSVLNSKYNFRRIRVWDFRNEFSLNIKGIQ